MESLFNLFSANLKSRYLTLLKNLKYKSNSFYDAYNSLMEELLKEIALKELKLEKLKGSIHDILNVEEVKNYLLNTLNITNTSYKKLLDYASKINQHKHKHEHELTLDSALSYFKLMYEFLYAYTSFKGLTIPNYDEDYLKRLFGSGIKDNKIDARLALMEAKLDDIYKYGGASENLEKEEAKKLNQKIQDKIYDLRIHGSRMFSYCYDDIDFKKEKRKIFIAAIILALVMLGDLIYSFIYFGVNFYPWFIVLSLFIAYYLYITITTLKFSDMVDPKKIKRLYLLDIIKLDDGNYFPYKGRTISGILITVAFILYLIMHVGAIASLKISEASQSILGFLFLIGATTTIVYKHFVHNFLVNYENVYLYDDEASVTYWPEFNQFVDFKFKK